MPRPSRHIDLVLLQAGRDLFPRVGCAGLSVRAVAAQAGANVGMFHYHFKSKDNFLRTLLQGVYEDIFTGLTGAVSQDGAAVERLRSALIAAGGLLATHRKVIARVWMDAVGGEPVATDFVRRNAPRHIGLLFGLVQEAQADGALRPLAPLQCMATLLGAVALPIVFASELLAVAMPAREFQRRFDAQVMSADAIAERVDIAIGTMRAVPLARKSSPRRRFGAR